MGNLHTRKVWRFFIMEKEEFDIIEMGQTDIKTEDNKGNRKKIHLELWRWLSRYFNHWTQYKPHL